MKLRIGVLGHTMENCLAMLNTIQMASDCESKLYRAKGMLDCGDVEYIIIPYSDCSKGIRCDQLIINYYMVDNKFIEQVAMPMLSGQVPKEYEIIDYDSLNISPYL